MNNYVLSDRTQTSSFKALSHSNQSDNMKKKCSNQSSRISYRHIIQGTLSITGFLLIAMGSNTAQAQSNPSNAINGGSVNFDNISPVQSNSSSSVNFPVDAGGSQQFFEQGDSRLYFLPDEEESESILKIDETVEAEGINYKDLYPQSSDE